MLKFNNLFLDDEKLVHRNGKQITANFRRPL